MMGVLVNHKMGIIIQQRNIDPKKGEWALPSGYVNFGESWEEAAVRENMEEMQIASTVDDYHLFGIRKPTTGNMLVFCTSRLFIPDDYRDENIGFLNRIESFVPNEEVSAMGIWYGDTELAFPSHNECAKDYLTMLKNTLSPWTY
jgi:8-oxo-dGTP pyrophosphatase MutT (NUDIX family)